MQKLYIVSLLLLMACGTSEENASDHRPAEWHGTWKAEWETPPASYPEMVDMEFYMNGSFEFTKDSLTVTANGYPGCIFNVDTLAHTQSWYVSNDTLFLVNTPGTPGMTYKVTSKMQDRIQLQLIEDIFVTLTK